MLQQQLGVEAAGVALDPILKRQHNVCSNVNPLAPKKYTVLRRRLRLLRRSRHELDKYVCIHSLPPLFQDLPHPPPHTKKTQKKKPSDRALHLKQSVLGSCQSFSKTASSLRTGPYVEPPFFVLAQKTKKNHCRIRERRLVGLYMTFLCWEMHLLLFL